MKKDKNQKYRGQEQLLLFPMEKNKTKAPEEQPPENAQVHQQLLRQQTETGRLDLA
jgi:hypothetical protein